MGRRCRPAGEPSLRPGALLEQRRLPFLLYDVAGTEAGVGAPAVLRGTRAGLRYGSGSRPLSGGARFHGRRSKTRRSRDAIPGGWGGSALAAGIAIRGLGTRRLVGGEKHVQESHTQRLVARRRVGGFGRLSGGHTIGERHGSARGPGGARPLQDLRPGRSDACTPEDVRPAGRARQAGKRQDGGDQDQPDGIAHLPAGI